ncbi:MAG: hypothetical protein EAX86_05560 [Candidatus Heimdallarchaeota archaeon]|nr:hypothetical protein [Candidatus Heimdallarchaeota archaeon]
MVFPISIYSKDDWLNLVPKFLITLAIDATEVEDESFQRYIASTLEEYFAKDSIRFIEAIKRILTQGSDEGRYVIIKSLIFARSIWGDLAIAETFQILLTELALSPDRIYAKNAAFLSSKLEDIRISKHKDFKPTVPLEEVKEVLDVEEEFFGSFEASQARAVEEPIPSPTPSSQAPLQPKSAPGAPPMPSKPATAPIKETKVEREFESKKRKKSIEKMEDVKEISEGTVHTHVHYYSRMNPRKTYPFTVTLSTLAKVLAQDKVHFLSGEEEKETRGEFKVTETTKQLIVEPLISGCLAQPTFQWIDPSPKNLPKELTFFITPLVEAGFRSTPLRGELLIKDDFGNILLKLKLHDLSVVSNRISQVLALVGTVGGGTMPALDFLFGIDLQLLLIQQLREQLPNLVSNIDLTLLLRGAQLSLFVGAIGLGILWWWRKGRAKLAPERSTQWKIPS